MRKRLRFTGSHQLPESIGTPTLTICRESCVQYRNTACNKQASSDLPIHASAVYEARGVTSHLYANTCHRRLWLRRHDRWSNPCEAFQFFFLGRGRLFLATER